MTYLILLFGLLILTGGALMIVKPDYISRVLTRYADTSGLHILAVTIRLILGATLLLSAAESKYPMAFMFLGWVTLIAAVVLSVIGRNRFRRLIHWATDIKPLPKGLMGLFAFLLGGFLIHAVL